MNRYRSTPWPFAIGMLIIAIIFVTVTILLTRPSTTSNAAATPTIMHPAHSTQPTAANEAFARQQHAVGNDFASYYTKYHGNVWLGQGITAEFPTMQGQEQIFANGALLLQGGKTVTALTLVQTLLTDGAQIPFAGSASTYYNLFSATPQQTAPKQWSAMGNPLTVGIFATQHSDATTTKPTKPTKTPTIALTATPTATAAVGYYIPPAFVPFLQKLGNWRSLIGPPITQALPTTTTVSGQAHHLLVQGFTRSVLIVDLNAAGQPAVTVEPVGADDLSILGPPANATLNGQKAWTTNAPITVLTQPNGGSTVATLLTAFGATLVGSGQWVNNVLWCHISWQVEGKAHDGWVSGEQISLIAPKTTPNQTVSLDSLSPSLAAYAQAQGDGLTVAVFSPDDQRTYVYNGDLTTVMASTAKLPILVTLLSQTETQQRSLTDNETQLATAMIEESDNDAAQALYEEVTEDSITSYLSSIGISGIEMNELFGYSTTTPEAVVELLNDLRTGTILNASDRAFALNLMSNIDPAQQFGVGETAPAGASYEMKDGWVVAEDGTWTTGSVGIVKTKHTYVIAVYAQGNANIDDGWAVVNHVCATVAALYS